MSMITSKILKFVDSAKTLKSTHLEDETFFSSNKKKNHSLYIKGYNMAKYRFLAEFITSIHHIFMQCLKNNMKTFCPRQLFLGILHYPY